MIAQQIDQNFIAPGFEGREDDDDDDDEDDDDDDLMPDDDSGEYGADFPMDNSLDQSGPDYI